EINSEYKSLEPNLSIIAELNEENFAKVMTDEAQRNFFNAMNAAHNGVYRMSPDIEDLVETSNNIAKVMVADGNIKIECLTRSSVESSKDVLANALTSTFELAGYKVKLAGDYPGWAPNMDSPILKVLDSLYQKMNGEKANVAACHAGLECGILGQNYPEMDMISFGPTIKGAHSPDERASISSAQKYWEFVLEILKNIPKK
ncbi:MAG: M20/M25/M40 family metallo-hydrolase, partial [Aequorivita sp.]|nr:M20/M25/M40 family metallo-hydrolase [Aequorivita sp.]